MKTHVRMFMVLLLVLFAASQLFAQGRRGQFELYAGAGIPLSPEGFKDYFKLGLSLNAQYVFFPTHRVGIPVFVGYERFTVDNNAIGNDLTPFIDAFLNEAVAGYTITDGVGNPIGVSTGGTFQTSTDNSGSASTIKFGAGVRPYLTNPESSLQFFLFGNASYNILKSELKSGYNVEGGSIEWVDFNNNPQTPIAVTAEDLAQLDIQTSGEETITGDENKFGIAVGAGVEVPAGSSLNLIFQGLYNIIFTENESTSFIGVTAGVVF